MEKEDAIDSYEEVYGQATTESTDNNNNRGIKQ